MIEGLTALEGPARGNLSSHKFSLPANFPSDKYASKWVEDGPEVQEAQQKQVIAQANVAADGWQVYRMIAPVKIMDDESQEKEPKKGPPKLIACTRVAGKKVYVLMYRPKALQKAVNDIYANQSRILVNQEVNGEKSAVSEGDPGILTNADLQKFNRHLGQDEGEQYLPPNAGSSPTQLQTAADIAIQ